MAMNGRSAATRASGAGDEQRFDGLSRAEALRICVRRHEELSSSQRAFIQTIGGRDKALTREQAARLTAIMEKFRQDDLVSYLAARS